MNREMIIVLDFGGQYNQLIARRVRECSVYCEVHPYDLSLEKIKEMNPKADLTLCLKMGHPAAQRRYLSWEYRFLESAMVPSL